MNSPNLVQQIMPTFAPRVNSIGDGAALIAQELARQFGLKTQVIVADLVWSGAVEQNGVKVANVAARSPQALNRLLTNAPIILHYEGYGFAQRGYPRWLKTGLKRWRRQYPDQPLLTIFHEIYPYHHGPPWTSSFWLAPLQRRLAGQLARMSDAILTSKESYAELLTTIEPKAASKITVRPIICNIGEPETIPPLGDRPRRLIVFGHPNSRRLVYQRDRALLLKICRELKIQAIDDIGSPINVASLAASFPIAIKEHGVLPATKVRVKMSAAIAGFVSFIPPEYLAKSSVYATFCAYGLIPILAQGAQQMMDGLQAQTHYWVASQDRKLSLEQGGAIAHNATAWYRHHDQVAYTQTLYNCLLDDLNLQAKDDR